MEADIYVVFDRATGRVVHGAATELEALNVAIGYGETGIVHRFVDASKLDAIRLACGAAVTSPVGAGLYASGYRDSAARILNLMDPIP
jgi:hypothetical protein